MNEEEEEDETWLTSTKTGGNTVGVVPSGSNQKAELLKEIAAQLAMLSSVQKLINQHHPSKQQEPEKNDSIGRWVYNMADLAHWIHHYTARRKLHCKSCDAEKVFVCETCGNKVEYQDDV